VRAAAVVAAEEADVEEDCRSSFRWVVVVIGEVAGEAVVLEEGVAVLAGSAEVVDSPAAVAGPAGDVRLTPESEMTVWQ